MKLKIFSPQTVGQTRKTFCKISLSRKSGLISLTHELVETVGLKDGAKILLFQDEARKKDWYIKKSMTDGFNIRSKKGSSAFNCTAIADNVLKSCDITANSAAFLVATEPTLIEQESYYAIITNKPYVRS